MVKKRYSPSKLTKQNVDAIAALIVKGLPKNQACDAVGIHRTTLHSWIMEADALDGKKPSNHHERMVVYARDEIRMARSKLLERIVLNIQVQGKEDWRAWAFMAERMFPTEMAEHKTVSADVTATVMPMLDALKRAAESIALEDGDNADST